MRLLTSHQHSALVERSVCPEACFGEIAATKNKLMADG
jgi:hypothetical protein